MKWYIWVLLFFIPLASECKCKCQVCLTRVRHVLHFYRLANQLEKSNAQNMSFLLFFFCHKACRKHLNVNADVSSSDVADRWLPARWTALRVCVRRWWLSWSRVSWVTSHCWSDRPSTGCTRWCCALLQTCSRWVVPPVGPAQYRVHKVVLCASSDVFQVSVYWL